MTKQSPHHASIVQEKSSFRVMCAHRFLKHLTKYAMVKWFQVFCGIYIVTISFSNIGVFGEWGGMRDPETGFIIDVSSKENTQRGVILIRGDERAVVANSIFQMAALAISRLAAYTMYPVLIAVFWSKFRATTNFISHTYFGELFVYKDLHELHVYCGYYILVAGILHTIFHISRYAVQGNLRILIEHPSGISGLVIIASTLLICLPMMIGKQKVRYEIRKYFHYLFVIFMVAMCFHVPRSGGLAPYVFGTLLVWWALDNIFVQCFMTERIKSSRFYVLPSGVQLTMAVSERFQRWGSGGYCYVCLPWVDRYQWHAFSLFENPVNPEERQVFMQKTGDWTTQVHDALGRHTSRPVWVQGPFVSPYGSAANYDNQIMVAGGIGITPALSTIREMKDTRRCNLIWATRDRHMLEFFVKHAEFDDDGWNLIFYTGKEPLLGIEDVVVTSNGATVYIIRERPKLHWILPNIIFGIESGTCLPEMLVPDDKVLAMELLQTKLLELNEKDPPLDSHAKLSKLENYCDEIGYFFSDLISQIPGYEDLSNHEGDHSVLDAIMKHGGGPSLNNGLTEMDAVHSLSGRSLDTPIPVGEETSAGRPGRRRSTMFTRHGPLTTGSWKALTRKARESIVQMTEKDLSDEDSDIEAVPLKSAPVELYKPWTHHEDAEGYVANLPEGVLSQWGVLYCGGKTPLEKALKEAARKADIEMHTESFAW